MNWIKTEDQLPIDKVPEDLDFRTKRVLGYQDGDYVIGYFFKWEHHDLKFATGYSSDLPTHWTHLPKPPKEAVQ